MISGPSMELGYRSWVFQWQWLRRNWDMQTRGLRFPSLLMFFRGQKKAVDKLEPLLFPNLHKIDATGAVRERM